MDNELLPARVNPPPPSSPRTRSKNLGDLLRTNSYCLRTSRLFAPRERVTTPAPLPRWPPPLFTPGSSVESHRRRIYYFRNLNELLTETTAAAANREFMDFVPPLVLLSAGANAFDLYGDRWRYRWTKCRVVERLVSSISSVRVLSRKQPPFSFSFYFRPDQKINRGEKELTTHVATQINH